MNPLLSYYGGKQRLSSDLIPLIPEHRLYVEPFCGGAALLFAKPIPPVTRWGDYNEVLNDKDERIITLYRVCQTNYLGLINLLQYTAYSEAEYQKAVSIVKNWNDYDDLWRAWAMYLAIDASFARKLCGGWGRGVTSESIANRWSRTTEQLDERMARLSRVNISCQDAIKCIQQWDSKDAFFYCDPPYVGTAQGHYDGYTLDDFKSLVSTLDSIKGDFMLSTYLVNGAAIPESWEVHKFDAFCSAGLSEQGSRTERTEIVYRRVKGSKIYMNQGVVKQKSLFEVR